MTNPPNDTSQGVLVAPSAPPSAGMPPGAIRCSRCESYWTGLAVCHCSGCCRTFSGITSFDLHRSGLHTGSRICLDPTIVLGKDGESRLVPVVKPHWSGWGLPTDDEHSWWGAT